MNRGGSVEDKTKIFIASYLRLAWEDCASSHQLFGRHSEPYLAQQAAEKLLNVILTSEGLHYNTRDGGHHNLYGRVKLIPDHHPWKDKLKSVAFLEDYATTYRYPRSTSGLVTKLDNAAILKVRVARNSLDKLIRAAADHFDVDLNFQCEKPAGNISPIKNENGFEMDVPKPTSKP